MSFDYSKLLGKIKEVYGTQFNFAIAMNVSERTLSLKLHSKRNWNVLEIKKAVKLLGISEKDIPEYFFKEKVQIN